jgi:hypothetical protein
MDYLKISIGFILGAVTTFILDYLREKGKNFARKEDIAQITDTQARVQNQYDAKLEDLKGEIRQIVSEHDTRYEYLHDCRGKVIDEVYKKIDKTLRLFGASARAIRLNFDSSPETQQQEARTTFWELFEYYFQNRLYLDQDLCTRIEQFFDVVFTIETNLGSASSLAIYLAAPYPEIINQHAQFVDEARKHIINDLPPIRDLIEKRMRAILGINHEKNASQGIPGSQKS